MCGNMDKKLVSVLLILMLVVSLTFVFARELEATVILPSVPNTAQVTEAPTGQSLVYYLRFLNKSVVDGVVTNNTLSSQTEPSGSGSASGSVSSQDYANISFSNMSLGNGQFYCFYKSVPVNVQTDQYGISTVIISGNTYSATKSGDFLRIFSTSISSCPVLNVDSKQFQSVLGINTSSGLWDNGSSFMIKVGDKENKFTVGSNKIITSTGFSSFSLDEIKTLEFDIGNSKKLIIAVEADTGALWGALPNSLKINSISSS